VGIMVMVATAKKNTCIKYYNFYKNSYNNYCVSVLNPLYDESHQNTDVSKQNQPEVNVRPLLDRLAETPIDSSSTSFCDEANAMGVEDPTEMFFLEYMYKNKKYKTQVQVKQNFEELIEVKNEKNEKVLKNILLWLGPNHDFHGLKYTPNMLGHKKLMFNNGLEILTFSNNEIINLNFEI